MSMYPRKKEKNKKTKVWRWEKGISEGDEWYGKMHVYY
jgi:hypothetical protein